MNLKRISLESRIDENFAVHQIVGIMRLLF